ncbi:MAG: septum formation inhibitor Maf [Campylobacterota bacterium]|nr:septum formation inhibitor Maf [Campylobacterota bacterium]
MIRLGSNSTTRALLLKQHNIDFVQQGGNFDEEQITAKDPKEFVKLATKGKFDELFKTFGCKDMPLLVADTVVTSNGELLRKAKDKDDARRMLELQSDNEVSIITCMIFKSEDTYIEDISTTTYKFSKFLKEDLDEYINSGECMGKAGAIMVEGFCKPYIESVDGYESTAMGLCVEKLLAFLYKLK